MATLTLKNVPDDLYRRLKESAARNRRSLNQEAIARLALGNHARPRAEVEAAFESARALRAEQAARGMWFGPDEIDALIEEGRP
jgi:antitoxin FitA